MPTNSTLQTLKDSKPELTKTRFNKINSKTKLTKAKFAFSLIEISVVILIIGILIAGISKGMDLYQDYRLTSAQNLTRNSIVNRISDLVAWYETTLPSSFKESEAKINNGYITIWNDNSLSTTKNNATATTPLNTTNQPILVKNAFNSLPALKLSGAQILNFDGTSLAQSNYTIFVAEMRNSSTANWIISGDNSGSNQSLHIGYRSNSITTLAHWNNDMNFATEGFSSPLAKIHRFSFDTINGKKYALNGLNIGGTIFIGDATTNLQPLTRSIGAKIGIGYSGHIAEIIIFKKALKTSEIKDIESYLSNKYSIKISGN